MQELSGEIIELSEYLSEVPGVSLSAEVEQKAAFHILDTVAAIISGSKMPAGLAAVNWYKFSGISEGGGSATIIGSSHHAPPTTAALCNGMSAHADETDDSHMETLSHPGCAVVPAALAVGEALGVSGKELLSAVVAGYDLGCRVGRAVGLVRKDLNQSQRSSHAMVGSFSASGAGIVLYRLDPAKIRYALSYTAQLSSGVTTWFRDTQHIEKAFVFAGMPASQGVLASSIAASGAPGVEDVFFGNPNWLEAVSPNPDRGALSRGLGKDFEIMQGTLKKYSVGSPAQAAVEAVVEMIRDEGVDAEGIEDIEISLPQDSAVIVDNRLMPSINCQYLVVCTLLDGAFSSHMAHDEPRMHHSDTLALLGKTRLVRDPETMGTRAAKVKITRRINGELKVDYRQVTHVRGTPFHPMSESEVRAKVEDLVAPVIGEKNSRELSERVLNLADEPDVRDLVALMA